VNVPGLRSCTSTRRSIIAQLGGELQLTAIFNDRQVLLDA
jgi:hypothetical protein